MSDPKLSFYNPQDRFSSLLYLSNLFYFRHEDAKAQDTLKEIEEAIESNVLDALVITMRDALSDLSHTLDPSICAMFLAFQKEILSEEIWCKVLSKESLIILGTLGHTRWALYRLLQKENPDLKIEADVLNLGAEHTSEEASTQYCSASINLDMVMYLAYDLKSARILLLELSRHPKYLALCEQCIQKHPDLAPSIAEEWQNLITSHILPKANESELRQKAEKLVLKHPEFEAVLKAESLGRESSLSSDYSDYLRLGINFLVGTVFASPYLPLTKSFMPALFSPSIKQVLFTEGLALLTSLKIGHEIYQKRPLKKRPPASPKL